ncbi:uncharacterized protein LOC116343873 [Contarinia nasturtii]|uniref:uncharacterized protein LOC116343873 n=1 Tax=Contarinia nasturtii TaxID=265458 RepID=UPI0012D41412|nr:uncharacterized protein LOC116343873 [Contarinia nasturtii]
MLRCSKQIEWMVFLLLGLVIGNVLCGPMYYKKTDDDTYEPDLVPVSSTVIPVYTYQVNSTGEVKHHVMDDEEYRLAYMKMKLMNKKRKQEDDPDTLITLTKKYHPGKKNKSSNENDAIVSGA